jgi:RNA polymerase sigma factor (sigma-70 family)
VAVMTEDPLPRAIHRLRLALAVDGATPDEELLRRFRDTHDRAAFETLVRRHGAGVLSACRRVLNDPADVDDAFQSAFLIFLRDAGSVRRGPAVGAWLYGVAHRVALRARSARRRRAQVEASVPDRGPHLSPDLSWQEACAILHEELDCLPDRYRLPLLLCYLDGLSRDEAAVRLGVSLNAVRNRLERGRARLRARLARRGITLSAGLLASVSAGPAVALSPRLIQSVLSTARPSARVAELVGTSGGIGTVKVLTALALAAGLLVGVGIGHDPLRAGPTSKQMPTKPTARADASGVKEASPEQLTVCGRVLNPDGKPVAGAKVWVLVQAGIFPKTKTGPKVVATTGPDGRFAFAEDGKDRGRYWISNARIVATVEGFGLAWIDAEQAAKSEVELKLVKDVPIKGRIVTLEGKPVAGARVRVLEVARPKDADLSKWLAELKARERAVHEITRDNFHFENRLRQSGHPLPGQPDAAITDADGRFAIHGLGAERLAELRIEGPTVATVERTVLTRATPNLTVPEDPGDSRFGTRTYFGSQFDFAAEPTQPFEGVVSDRETGRPVAGATVRAARLWYELTTVTDKDGRYRLTGLPPGAHELIACPTPDQPYHRMSASGGVKAGQKPVTLHFPLTRGVWVSGKVVNARTGEPEAGAPVRYVPLAAEPAYEAVPGSRAWSHEPTTFTAADGSFRVVAFPCRGAIAVTGFSSQFIAADQRPVQGDVSSLDPGMLSADSIATSPVLGLLSYHAAAIVNVDPKMPKEYTITLDPGVTVKAKLVDGAGRPIKGAHVGAQSTWALWSGELQGPEVEITQFNPERPRSVLFLHVDKRIGKLVVPKPGDVGPWTVSLEPTGTATGRLVTEDGKAVPNAVFRIHYLVPGRDVWTPSMVHDHVRTDADGAFTIPNLIPDLTYSLDHAADKGGGRQKRHYRHVKVKVGETRDLGDWKPADE